MNAYQITATLGSRSNTITIHEPDDTEATFAAMFMILDSAQKSDLWAKGEIVLTGPEGVIRTMPAKT